MQLDHNYLKQLPKPQNAIVPSIWNTWTQDLRQQFSANENQDFVNLFGMNMSDISRNLGLVWATKHSPTLREVVGMTYEEAITKPHISSDKKRSMVLAMSRLNELDVTTLEKIAFIPPSEAEIHEKEKEPLYDKARASFNNFLTDAKKNLTNDNYEESWKGFIKLVMTEVFSLTEFRTENLQRFVKVLFTRFETGDGMMDLARKFDMQPGVVNHHLRSFEDSFINNFMKDERGAELLQGKIAKFYWAAFDTLDTKDLKKRNARLVPVKEFCRALLGADVNTIEV